MDIALSSHEFRVTVTTKKDHKIPKKLPLDSYHIVNIRGNGANSASALDKGHGLAAIASALRIAIRGRDSSPD